MWRTQLFHSSRMLVSMNSIVLYMIKIYDSNRLSSLLFKITAHGVIYNIGKLNFIEKQKNRRKEEEKEIYMMIPDIIILWNRKVLISWAIKSRKNISENRNREMHESQYLFKHFASIQFVLFSFQFFFPILFEEI